MSLHRKHRLRRWIVRILLILVLLPIAAMLLVRTTGWMRMRKSDWDIRSSLQPHEVNDTIVTIPLRGRNISYLKTFLAPAKEEAMIFVHGSPGSLDAYLDYMADTSLLAKVDLISYDRPGFGNSDFGKSETSLSGQADILNALMTSLGYQKYWLVGHSYGAPVLLHAAMRRPARINGMCLIAGSVSPELESKSWRKWLDIPIVREIMPVSMRVSNEELTSLRYDLALMEDDWDRLTMPVTIIHGTNDILVPFENVAYAQEKLVNADTVFTHIMNSESHFILWTHEEEIVKNLLELSNH